MSLRLGPSYRSMKTHLSLSLAILLAAGVADAGAKATVTKLDGLVIMSPSPTQAPPPGLRLRTMVRPADRLWIGPDIPREVPFEVGELKLDLLDARPGGGWVATYRERFEPCYARGEHANCGTLVKIFDKANTEVVSLSLDSFLSHKDHLEVQDVRFVASGAGGALYFNEACQSYSSEAGGKCSALIAVDPFAKKVLWRTAPLASNNEFLVQGDYLVAAYGFTGEKASIRIVRRSDGKVMEQQPLQHTNFEMFTSKDTLSVEMYYTFGRANFRMEGFAGAAPKLVPLANTPPDPKDKPKPYDPPLIKPAGPPGLPF